MSPTDHEHTFVWDGQELLPCACGAEMMAIESVLHPAADDAGRLAGDPYYTGCRLRQELEAVELSCSTLLSRCFRSWKQRIPVSI